MICQKCLQSIPHKVGDMIVTIRIKNEDNDIYADTLKMVFCLKCADELILSKVRI